MLRLQPKPTRRRGAVTPLTAILLVFMMALLSLSVDLGYIAVVRAQLQNAADAAALAGASQLLDKTLLEGGSQTTATSLARTEAYTFANKDGNKAGGVLLAPDLNASNATAGDIVLGYLEFPLQSSLPDPSDIRSTYQAGQPGYFYLTPPTDALYNAVRARVYRHSSHAGSGNGPLSLFFAKALGTSTQDLQATATACIQGGVLGFKSQTPGRDFCALLPLALDINVWNDQIVNGTGPDSWMRTTPASGAYPPDNVTASADAIHESKLFPVVNTSGVSGIPSYNVGTVNIGLLSNSISDVKRQILLPQDGGTGVSAGDLAWFSAANGYPNGFKMSPDASSPTGYSMTLQGEMGLNAGVESELQFIIGQPRILPLYSTATANGNATQYTIVKFVGVTIVEVDLHGSTNSQYVTIQPCFVVEPNTICGGTSEASQFVVRPIALVR